MVYGISDKPTFFFLSHSDGVIFYADRDKVISCGMNESKWEIEGEKVSKRKKNGGKEIETEMHHLRSHHI